MKRIVLILTVLCLSAAAYADIPRPDKTPKKAENTEAVKSYLSVKIDRDAREARLIIPRSKLQELRAQLDALDADNGTAATISAGGLSPLQTIVSGAFISLAFVFAGVWLKRSNKLSTGSGRAAAAGLVVCAGGLFAAIAYGNVGPPPEARSITGAMFSESVHLYKSGGGNVKLEIADTDHIKLIVPDAKPGKVSE